MHSDNQTGNRSEPTDSKQPPAPRDAQQPAIEPAELPATPPAIAPRRRFTSSPLARRRKPFSL